MSGLVLLLVGSGFWFASVAGAADVKAAPKAATQKKAAVYVASKGSDKYHVPSCAAAAAIKPANKITFGSKAEAAKAGYKPCGTCCKA